MMDICEPIEELLRELEHCTEAALAEARSGNVLDASKTIEYRGDVVRRLTGILPASTLSYQDWNRLVIVHFQGNQLADAINQARMEAAARLVEMSRQQALLDCMAGVCPSSSSGQISETA